MAGQQPASLTGTVPGWWPHPASARSPVLARRVSLPVLELLGESGTCCQYAQCWPTSPLSGQAHHVQLCWSGGLAPLPALVQVWQSHTLLGGLFSTRKYIFTHLLLVHCVLCLLGSWTPFSCQGCAKPRASCGSGVSKETPRACTAHPIWEWLEGFRAGVEAWPCGTRIGTDLAPGCLGTWMTATSASTESWGRRWWVPMSLQQDLRGGGKQEAWLFLGAVGLHVHPHAGLGAPCFPAAAFPYTPAASGDLPPPICSHFPVAAFPSAISVSAGSATGTGHQEHGCCWGKGFSQHLSRASALRLNGTRLLPACARGFLQPAGVGEGPLSPAATRASQPVIGGDAKVAGTRSAPC